MNWLATNEIVINAWIDRPNHHPMFRWFEATSWSSSLQFQLGVKISYGFAIIVSDVNVFSSWFVMKLNRTSLGKLSFGTNSFIYQFVQLKNVLFNSAFGPHDHQKLRAIRGSSDFPTLGDMNTQPRPLL
jgi:hypothetical protein